jgi:hypothetical protein
MSATVLVTKPKALTPSDKGLLRKAGIICVESDDPSSVRFLSAESPPLGGNDLLYAAMAALSTVDSYSTGKHQREVFATQVALLVKATRPESK